VIDTIKKYQHKIPGLLHELQDVRMLGLLAFLVLALMISWSGVKIIEINYKLQKDIATLTQQNEVRKLENRNLALQNQYYNSDEYLELEARKNFGLAAPGEKVIVVSQDAALRNTKPEPTELAPKKTEKKSKQQQNFDAWMDFLLHRTDAVSS
jgi:cell division protein FtsB